MTDLERIHFIEETFGFKLHHVPIERLRYDYMLKTRYDNGTRNYSTNSNGDVIGLALDFSPIFLLPKNYLSGFKSLNQLRLKSVFLSDTSFLKELRSITSLDLSYNRGIKSYSFLKELRGITSLDLRNNNLSDVSFLKELKDINSLDLSYNNLNDISFLKELKGVNSLYLRNNSLNDVSFLKELKSINSLDLRNNRGIKNYSFLKELKGINSLDLRNNNLSDVSFLKELKAINSLDLSYNRGIKNYSFLKEIKSINSLYLSSNSLTDVSFLKELKAINSLDLRSNNLSDVSFLKELKAINSLYLSSNNLSDVSFLKELKAINSLYLSSNKGTKNFSFLKDLKDLTSLDLRNNSLTDVSFLKELKGINSLYLSSNNLSDVSFLKELKAINSLDLSYNKGIKNYSFLKELKHITSLDLSSNNLTDVSFLKELKGITSLYLSYNSLTDVSFLKELKGITSLYLNSNNLIEASFLKGFKNITSLYLNSNNLSDASFLKELKGITSLNLDNNPIVIPPKEIVEKGIEAIHEYFRQKEEQGEDFIYEAKMLILGEGGAGKTSMVRKFLDSASSLPDEDETTRGIDIVKWKFPFHCVKQDKNVEFAVNTWDFGGQDIYHATHRFFLSERTLYIIMADTRQDNTDFFYWLHICELFGGVSPVLIVLNEKHDRTRSIDYNTLRGQFEGLRDKMHVNFSNNRGLNDLINKVQYYITNQQHIGQPIPAGWVKVRSKIERIVENSITRKDYLKICEDSGISSDDSKLQSQYFHDIGVFLHFIDDDILSDTIFLKPAWITNAVFKIIDCSKLNDGNGHFDRELVEQLLPNAEYDCMHGKILQLMKKFRLIFEIGNSKQYVSPQHLNDSKPEYEKLANAISVRYKYEIFMPKGIVNQLTVAMHSFIASLDLIWKSGVIFKWRDSRAEVIESYNKREITIAAEGPYKRDLMTLIVQNIDNINESYKKLKVNKYIPCNCETCSTLDIPHEFKYDTLQHFTKNYQPEIQCQKSFKMVMVRSLVDEVVDEEQLKSKFKGIKLIKIFLASSAELSEDRKEFENFIGRKNKEYIQQGIFLDIIIWEDFIDAMSATRLQDEYNKAIVDCDIFVSLFHTKVGKYTNEEFDKAFGTFKTEGKPLVYTYFKDSPINIHKITPEINTLLNFKQKLNDLGHFPTIYNNIDDLKYKFGEQLVKTLKPPLL